MKIASDSQVVFLSIKLILILFLSYVFMEKGKRSQKKEIKEEERLHDKCDLLSFSRVVFFVLSSPTFWSTSLHIANVT